METKIIDGRALASRMRADLALKVATMARPPCLAVVIVGDDAASRVYVAAKARAATAAGINSRILALPAQTTQDGLAGVVRDLNADVSADAILVQLPLPPHLDAATVMQAVDPEKDVDGFHPANAGQLATGGGMVPCTAAGIMFLLKEAGAVVEGSRALVIGWGAIAGRPASTLLLRAGATVTVAHKMTRNLAEECRRAEIVVSAAGSPGLVGRAHLARGSTVIDVGINRLADGSLVGDASYAECLGWVGAITPVPGGVGPMTIACLLENTLKAARRTG